MSHTTSQAKLTRAHGACLCGAVSITANTTPSSVGACHCNSCRKWCGGPLMGVNCGKDVIIEGDFLQVYRSSDWAQRGFCGRCGTHLFCKIDTNQDHHIPVGVFDTDLAAVFDHQIFIEQKPAYYDFSNKTATLTGEQVFASIAPVADEA